MCKGIFFVKMQAKRGAFGPKNSQKSTFKDHDGILIKISNEKSDPSDLLLFSKLRICLANQSLSNHNIDKLS